MVICNLEFFGGAQHALAFDPTQLAHFDFEGFTVFGRWQLCPHQGTRNFDAHTGVGCTTDDVEQAALPHVDLTDAQAIGVWVLHSRFDFTHHDPSKGRRNSLKVFNLQPRHGQGIGECLSREGGVAKFAQPGFG